MFGCIVLWFFVESVVGVDEVDYGGVLCGGVKIVGYVCIG